MKNLKYACVNIFSKNKNDTYILLGFEDYNKKYSSFGGHIEKNENAITALYREFFEETIGLYGNKQQTKKFVDKHLKHKYIKDKTLIYNIEIPYNKNIVIYFNNIYNYINKCMIKNKKNKKLPSNYITSCPIGYFEKSKLKWINIKNVKKYKIENYCLKDIKMYINNLDQSLL